MKLIIALFTLVIFSSCASDDTVELDENHWTVQWSIDNHTAQGKALFLSNNKIKIIIDEPDHILFSQKEEVLYDMNINSNQMSLTRLDNNFLMTYEILEQGPDHYLLQYEGDLIVKISR